MSRNLHHANLLIGAKSEGEAFFNSLCKDLGVPIANNPDVIIFRTRSFGIDESRELRSISTRKALALTKTGQKGRKFFFIAPERLTLEAQNALLKVFEDPSPETYFFLVAREEGLIIPTLRSRMETIRVSGGLAGVTEEVMEFLSSPLKQRLIFAKEFAENGGNLIIFLDDLLLLLRKNSAEKHLVEKVYSMRQNITDSTAATRLIIEHLSLVL